MSIDSWIDRMIESKQHEKYCVPDNACIRYGEVVKGVVTKCLKGDLCEKNRLHLGWRGGDVKDMPNYVIHNSDEKPDEVSQEDIDNLKQDFFNSL